MASIKKLLVAVLLAFSMLALVSGVERVSGADAPATPVAVKPQGRDAPDSSKVAASPPPSSAWHNMYGRVKSFFGFKNHNTDNKSQ